MIIITTHLIINIVTLLIVVWAFRNTQHLLRKKRRELISAAYYHVCRAIETLEPLLDSDKDEEIRKQFETDKSYMPHVPRSSTDDLTYDQIIELMEFMIPKRKAERSEKEQEKEQILRYFYNQLSLHAITTSFDFEHVRSWSLNRKLQLWETFTDYRKRTLDSAQKAQGILDKLRLKNRSKWWERPF